MEEWQRRVIDEAAELSLKLADLDVFIETSKTFTELEPVEQGLLRSQHGFMMYYLRTLRERIERFTP